MPFDPTKIEEKILPLVAALNDTGILYTCSSCQGHFEESDQELQDRNKADVRFDPADNISLDEIEKFINYIFVEFNERESFSPISMRPYKLYIPHQEGEEADFVFVIELEPFDRFDAPLKKRVAIDNAINVLTVIVREYTTRRKSI